MGVSGKPRTESFCFNLGLRCTDSFEVEADADDGAGFLLLFYRIGCAGGGGFHIFFKRCRDVGIWIKAAKGSWSHNGWWQTCCCRFLFFYQFKSGFIQF